MQKIFLILLFFTLIIYSNGQNNSFAGLGFSLQSINWYEGQFPCPCFEYNNYMNNYNTNFFHRFGDTRFAFSAGLSYSKYKYEVRNSPDPRHPQPLYSGNSPRFVSSNEKKSHSNIIPAFYLGIQSKNKYLISYLMIGNEIMISFKEINNKSKAYFNFHYDSTQAIYINDGYTYNYTNTITNKPNILYFMINIKSGVMFNIKNTISINLELNFQNLLHSNGKKILGLTTGIYYNFRKRRTITEE